jgi:N-acetyl-anhydromuramyl-L-alanine amidase AmpD
VIVSHRSPNQGPRPAGVLPRLIVIHADAGRSDGGTVGWVRSPSSKVSYHALIGRDGRIYTFVAPDARAWACGVSSWQGVPNVNDFSLSVALANRHDGTERMTDAQAASLRTVIADWKADWPIEAVTTHAAIAPGRKDDPNRVIGFRLEDFA